MLAWYSSAALRHQPLIALKRFCSSALAAVPVHHSRTDERLKQWSVIDDARKASKAIEALLRLPDDTPVAWSTHTKNAETSPAMVSMCGYAGDSFEDGAYIYIQPHTTQESAVWGLFREYFRDELTRCVCFDVRSFTNDLQSRGIRAYGRVHDVQAMVRMDGRQAKDLDTCCQKVLAKRIRERRRSLFGDFKRALTNDGECKESMNEQSMLSCRADAHAILHVYDEVSKRMRKKAVLSNFAKNTFEAYDKFYARAEKQLAEIGKQGLYVDKKLMNAVKSEFEGEGDVERAVFERWAIEHYTPRCQVNLTAAMLRHLLFAPYTNVHNESEGVGAEKRFSVRELKGVKKGKTEKKRIAIRGAGLAAQMYTRNGVPSVGTSALQKVISRSEESDDVGVQSASRAVSALLNWQDSRKKWERFERNVMKVVDDDGVIAPRTSIEFDKGRIESNLSEDVYRVMGVQSGHELMRVDLKNVKLCALAELSGCDVLYKRLAHKEELHALLAREFSREIQEAVVEGRCVVSGDGVRVSQVFPEKVRMARMLDMCMAQGGRMEVVKTVMKCDEERGRRLVEGWLDVHAGVRRWLETSKKVICSRKRAETVCGQQWGMRLGRGTESGALNKAVALVIAGSARDVVLRVCESLWESELVKALGWRVALVDGSGVVLQGARHAAHEMRAAVVHALSARDERVMRAVMAQSRTLTQFEAPRYT